MISPKGYSKLMVEGKIYIFAIDKKRYIFIGYNNISRSLAWKN